jgi:hypothetical protein
LLFVFDDAGTVPTVAATIDDGSPLRVTLVPADDEVWNVPVYDVVVQAYFGSMGDRKLDLTFTHASQLVSSKMLIDVDWPPEEVITYAADGSRVLTYPEDYIELADKTPLIPLRVDQLDVVRFGDIGFTAAPSGRVRIKLPVTAKKPDMLSQLQTQIDWGDGVIAPALIQPDGKGGYVILADHYYANGGKHSVKLNSDLDGVQIESAQRTLRSSPKEGFVWHGNPNYDEIAAGIDYGAYDVAFDLPLLQVFDSGLNLSDVSITVVFDDGSPVNVYKEIYAEGGEWFIYSNLEVYFAKPGVRSYSMVVEWKGKRAEIHGRVNAKPYSAEGDDEGAYILTDIGELLVTGNHGISGAWFDPARPLKPAAPASQPLVPVISVEVPSVKPVPVVTGEGQAEPGDAQPNSAWGIGFREDIFIDISEHWTAGFFNEDDEVAWLAVVS